MNVKELKILLSKCDDNDLVILSSDSEGNNYSPLSEDCDECVYEAESKWSGRSGLRELTDELISQGYSEEDLCENGVNSICLYPMN